jgi:hypothetical protein
MSQQFVSSCLKEPNSIEDSVKQTPYKVLTHSLTYLLTHSLTHSRTYLLTYLLTREVIHNFLLLYFHDQKMNIDNFSISNYEKVVFTADKMHLNMEEIGVYPRGMLYVHDLDA